MISIDEESVTVNLPVVENPVATQFETEKSVRLAEVALYQDGVTSDRVGQEDYNRELHTLANLIGELQTRVNDPRLYEATATDTGLKFYRVYSGKLRIGEALSAVDAFHDAYNGFTACEALG